MAVDMFLKLDGVKGESKDKNHPKQIGLLSWSWGMSRSGSDTTKNDFFELPRREYSGLEGFCGALAVNCPAPAKAPLAGLNDHEADRLPEINYSL
jgi:hypothetical protein